MAHEDPTLVRSLTEHGTRKESLPVRISKQIIRHFSEGQYKSPNKAVEELVSNSYDAGASAAHVVLPDPDDPDSSLWVVDDGEGMNTEGFKRLWTIAKSTKADVTADVDRPPIGQFGIGKLAAYVLARHLTHVSRTDAGFFFTSMDFDRVNDIDDDAPPSVDLQSIDADAAREALRPLFEQQADLEKWLFGPESRTTWTVAALSELKELGRRLRPGQLKWVLRTGLPIAADFSIFVDGEELESSRLRHAPLAEFSIGGDEDSRAEELGIRFDKDGILVKGLGRITGKAAMYEKPLSEGKSSEQYHRNHGYFVKVRRRVINLEDELFGHRAQSHGAWSRFYMIVEADGLRKYLLSSREGVRDEEPVRTLRQYMHETFLACRKAYNDKLHEDLRNLDLERLLEEAPSLLVSEPLVGLVEAVARGERSPKFIKLPENEPEEWLPDFKASASDRPFQKSRRVQHGPYAQLGEYNVKDRTLDINDEHPFVSKLAGSKSDAVMQMFVSAEVLSEGLLREAGASPQVADDFLNRRDRVLRVLAGEYPANAAEAIRLLSVADDDETALERAIGIAFEVLGFEYEKRGGHAGGTDGLLKAKLARQAGKAQSFKVVFDAKTTGAASVPASKLDHSALKRFQEDEKAQYRFFLAKAYAGQDDPGLAANDEARREKTPLLRTGDLRKLVELHARYGTTLSEVRDLLESTNDIESVRAWMEAFEERVSDPDRQVPLKDLLDALEEQKSDEKSDPNIYVARERMASLKRFDPVQLAERLRGIQQLISERFIEVGDMTVVMHQSPDGIIEEVSRALLLSFGRGDDEG